MLMTPTQSSDPEISIRQWHLSRTTATHADHQSIFDHGSSEGRRAIPVSLGEREALTSGPSREMRIMRDKRLTLAAWTAIGAGVGVALGLAMGTLALWLAIGVGIGPAIGAGRSAIGRK